MDAKEYATMKNYNIFALQGDTKTTDLDVCETLGLDPELAGTPRINDAAIAAMKQQNYEGYLANGYSDTEAQSMASAKATAAKQLVADAMKNR